MTHIILEKTGAFNGPYTEDAANQALGDIGGMILEVPTDKVSYDEFGELKIDLTVAEWKQVAEKATNKAADAYRQKFVPDELAEEYKIKEAAALAHLSGTATTGQTAMLAAENTDLNAQANIIIAKAAAFAQIWPLIIGMRTQTNAAIRAAKSFKAIIEILQNSQTNAAKQFAELNT